MSRMRDVLGLVSEDEEPAADYGERVIQTEKEDIFPDEPKISIPKPWDTSENQSKTGALTPLTGPTGPRSFSSDHLPINGYIARNMASDKESSMNGSQLTAETTLTTESTGSHNNNATEKPTNTATPLWDLFKMVPWKDTDKAPSSSCDNIVKLIKLIMYIFIFMFLVIGPLVSRVSLMLITNLLRTTEKLTERRQVVIVCITTFIVPDLFLFVSSCAKAIFGRRTAPSMSTLIYIFFVEGMYAAGLCVLVFKVLPFLDILSATAIFNTIGLVPAVVNLITSEKPERKPKAILSYFFTIFAVLAHFALLSLVAYYVSTKMSDSHLQTFSTITQLNTTKITKTTLSPANTSAEYLLYICVGALVVSLRWWENFAKNDLRLGRLTIPFKTLAANLHRRRDKTYIFASLWRMIVFTGVTLTFEYNIATHLDVTEVSVNWFLVGSCGVHVVVSYFVYHLSTVACKLCMQVGAFSVPLSIGGLLYLILVCMYTEFIAGEFPIPESLQPILPDLKEFPTYLYTSIISCIASQLWLNSHIWQPINERLAPSNRLFILPHYSGMYVDQSLLLTRRRDDNLEESIIDGNDRQTATTDISGTSTEDEPVTKIKICATMWHETEEEMLQMFVSVCRLDFDQCARRLSKEKHKYVDPDYYEFDAHVFFDDAMETKDNMRKPNKYVKTMMNVIEKAASIVNKGPVKLEDPVKMATPYGGRLVWTLPGENTITIHMKDKDKARNKKRWSQVMYMYYLLGHCIVEKECAEYLSGDNTLADPDMCLVDRLPIHIRKQVNRTFILALDGDIDFQPEAVRLLVDRMKKNDKVGAACGRIKPIGSGPVAWYQKFEYAVGHWLTKAAEHIYGCVLCSPGCFSLFRATALMDNNVMRTYAIEPTKARQYLQYDQGEDRWLCTLILQQKYRIEYCAASDSLTHCPESFKEFFKQRRRWVPSTMANIIDLLESYSHTVKMNDNISYMYMIYQAVLLGSTVLGPATILLMIMSSIQEIFRISYWVSGVISILPSVFFIIICLKCRDDIQIQVAQILSAIFALLMMTVIVGTIWNITNEGWVTPGAIFFYIMIGSFLFAGICHPQEISDLFWGGVYFICIPSGFVFLMIYSICNLHVVSWGTRETAISKDPPIESPEQTTSNLKKEVGIVSRWLLSLDCCKRKSILQSILKSVQRLEHYQNNFTDRTKIDDDAIARDALHTTHKTNIEKFGTKVKSSNDTIVIMNQSSESWLADLEFRDGNIAYLDTVEEDFWNRLLETYLHPLPKDPEKEKEVANSLKDLRNKVVAGFFMMNSLWLVIMMAMQQVQDSVNIVIGGYNGEEVKLQPLGLAYLGVFGIIITLQFIAMIKHRYGTMMHIISTTNLRQNPEQKRKYLIENTKDQQKMISVQYTVNRELRPEVHDTIAVEESRYLTRNKTRQVMGHVQPTNEYSNRYYYDRFGDEMHKNSTQTAATGTYGQSFAMRHHQELAYLRGPSAMENSKIAWRHEMVDSNQAFHKFNFKSTYQSFKEPC